MPVPYPRLNSLKTIPITVTHTNTAYFYGSIPWGLVSWIELEMNNSADNFSETKWQSVHVQSEYFALAGILLSSLSKHYFLFILFVHRDFVLSFYEKLILFF